MRGDGGTTAPLNRNPGYRRCVTTLRVAETGEEGLLAQIVPLLPTGSSTLLGPGDDAAVLATPDGRVVVSTDVLVEDQHFRLGWGTGADLGWRAAAQNLADIAAMGARPTGIVVGLVLRGDVEVGWVLDMARGMAQACDPLGVGVVGGDLSLGDRVVVAVTVHGDLEGRDPVLRSGARPGDVVALAGTLGRARAGFEIFAPAAAPPGAPAGGEELDGTARALGKVFLRPQPPVDLGVVAAQAGARSMMDVSDGLLRDAGRIARASDVRIELDSGLLEPFVAPLRAFAAQRGADPLEWVLTGGEDHGLLATFADDGVLPAGFVRLGTVAAGEAGVVVDGHPWTGSPGYDHFGAG